MRNAPWEFSTYKVHKLSVGACLKVHFNSGCWSELYVWVSVFTKGFFCFCKFVYFFFYHQTTVTSAKQAVSGAASWWILSFMKHYVERTQSYLCRPSASPSSPPPLPLLWKVPAAGLAEEGCPCAAQADYGPDIFTLALCPGGAWVQPCLLAGRFRERIGGGGGRVRSGTILRRGLDVGREPIANLFTYEKGPWLQAGLPARSRYCLRAPVSRPRTVGIISDPTYRLHFSLLRATLVSTSCAIIPPPHSVWPSFEPCTVELRDEGLLHPLSRSPSEKPKQVSPFFNFF